MQNKCRGQSVRKLDVELATKRALADFRRIPGVGRVIAQDLWNLGYRSVDALKNEDPEQMYDALCVLQGCQVDRCMLYVFRCAVYFASMSQPDPERLKWWSWKDPE